MPASLATALVLLAVEVLRAYRAKRENRQDDHDQPDERAGGKHPYIGGSLGQAARRD